MNQDKTIHEFNQEIFLFYAKAKESLYRCFESKENEFLRLELGFPIEEMIVIEKDIKIVFCKRDFEHYVVEAKLLLYKGTNEIGKYTYLENNKNEIQDDFLVIY